MARDKSSTLSRQQKERFRKRRFALFKRATAMLEDGADVYIILHRRNRFYTYTTRNTSTWPPCVQDLVSDPSKHIEGRY